MMLIPDVRWTPDCSGKQDYDGALVEVSTRYWPRGGGFYVLTADGRWQGDEARPEIRPSAKSSILLRHSVEGVPATVELVARDFEADSEAEVKAAVEAWVADRFAELCASLRLR